MVTNSITNLDNNFPHCHKTKRCRHKTRLRCHKSRPHRQKSRPHHCKSRLSESQAQFATARSRLIAYQKIVVQICDRICDQLCLNLLCSSLIIHLTCMINLSKKMNKFCLKTLVVTFSQSESQFVAVQS